MGMYHYKIDTMTNNIRVQDEEKEKKNTTQYVLGTTLGKPPQRT
jgi:hypothetical protein